MTRDCWLIMEWRGLLLFWDCNDLYLCVRVSESLAHHGMAGTPALLGLQRPVIVRACVGIVG